VRSPGESCRRLPVESDPRPGIDYAVRRGRLSLAQRRFFEEIVPAYEVDAGARADWREVFGRAAPLAVEIGTGSGEHIAAHARMRPDMDHVAIEIYPPGMVRLVSEIVDREITNLRIIAAPVQTALEEVFADGGISLAYALFPDPWPKLRHRRRRLVSPSFAALLARKLRLGASFCLATDSAEYFRWARRSLASAGCFTEERVGWERVCATKYEIKAARQGRAIHEMSFRLATELPCRRKFPTGAS